MEPAEEDSGGIQSRRSSRLSVDDPDDEFGPAEEDSSGAQEDPNNELRPAVEDHGVARRHAANNPEVVRLAEVDPAIAQRCAEDDQDDKLGPAEDDAGGTQMPAEGELDDELGPGKENPGDTLRPTEDDPGGPVRLDLPPPPPQDLADPPVDVDRPCQPNMLFPSTSGRRFRSEWFKSFNPRPAGEGEGGV